MDRHWYGNGDGGVSDVFSLYFDEWKQLVLMIYL